MELCSVDGAANANHEGVDPILAQFAGFFFRFVPFVCVSVCQDNHHSANPALERTHSSIFGEELLANTFQTQPCSGCSARVVNVAGCFDHSFPRSQVV